MPETPAPKDPDLERLKLALDHGRGMFVYHAGQRHSSIRFYFAVLGFLFAAIATILSKLSENGASVVTSSVAIVLIATFGILVSWLFLHMDKRNETLVECDEALLKVAERRLANSATGPTFNTFKTIEASDSRVVAVESDALDAVAETEMEEKRAAERTKLSYSVLVPRLLHLSIALFSLIILGIAILGISFLCPRAHAAAVCRSAASASPLTSTPSPPPVSPSAPSAAPAAVLPSASPAPAPAPRPATT